MTEPLAAYRKLPQLRSRLFTRERFDELFLAYPQGGYGWSIDINRADSIFMTQAVHGRPAEVLLVRQLKPGDDADVQRDYRRVCVYDIDGILRTSAKTASDRKFLEEMFAAALPAVAKHDRKRALTMQRALKNLPKVDAEALSEVVRAMTHSAAQAPSIVNKVLLAARDPTAYIKANEALCREYGIFAPQHDLHVIAFLQHMPPRYLLAFDWKETMHEVLPMLARRVALVGERLAVPKLRPRCDAWDEHPREKALAEIAATLKKTVMVSLAVDADTHYVTVMSPGDAKRVAAWKKKTALPLEVVRKSSTR